ncbi:nucleotidyl transferase AbiEii/AbiGii toxin family protein [Candidatus Gracilibacteria bacterium]|nr:nucleotidyl transferase AbiEii/AbiGii toxin family protein [Candidatus Gracilibacteria bacterium]
MFLPLPQDAIHKAWLYRTLTAIIDDQYLFDNLRFKGGTCGAMRGFLDRFSVDLDFDYIGIKKDLPLINKHLKDIFKNLGLEIKDHSLKAPQYFLKYPSKTKSRNTLKVDITFPPPQNNKYETVRLEEIDRLIQSQTIESMFANKLVALIERFEKNNSIAGRDVYDIHHYFLNGYKYDQDIILERRKTSDVKIFLEELKIFIEKTITEKILTQDLNMLLSPEKFKRIRKILKKEVLMFIQDDIDRN